MLSIKPRLASLYKKKCSDIKDFKVTKKFEYFVFFAFFISLLSSQAYLPAILKSDLLKIKTVLADGTPVQVSAGNGHACIVKSDGTVWCWGANYYGQLGDSTDETRHTPIQVVGVGGIGFLTDIVAVNAGWQHTCGLKNDGTVYCWGDNADGELGNNDYTDSYVPVQVLGVGGTGFLNDIKAIGAGYNDSCALTNSGLMYCWGDNADGQLGDNSTTGSPVPVQVVGAGGAGFLNDISKIELGLGHACAVKNDGTAYCWGDSYTPLGDGTSNSSQVPVQVVGVGGVGFLSNIADITTDDGFSCALTNDGYVYCWGDNGDGQLGDGNGGTYGDESLTPVQVLGVGGVGLLSNIQHISNGTMHACALDSGGNVYCWGWKEETGTNDGSWDPQTTPIQTHGLEDVGFLSDIFTFAAGDYFTVAIDTAGTVYSWGENYEGDLGDWTEVDRYVPVKVVSSASSAGYLDNVVGVGTADDGSCIIKDDGTVWCWGNGEPVPVQLRGPGGVGFFEDAVSISKSAMGNHFCVVKSDGTVWCWGSNSDGQLGDGTTTSSYDYPIQVVGEGGVGYLTDVKMVSGAYFGTCALKNDGTVWCWGYNGGGALGNNSTTDVYTPVQVHGVNDVGFLTDIKYISTGGYHGCAIKTDDSLYCWGSNSSGQLGDNTTLNKLTPIQVLGAGGIGNLTDVRSVAMGWLHTCASKNDGTAYCWGRNYAGQVGNGVIGGFGSHVDAPSQVIGVGGVGYLTGVDTVAASRDGSYAKMLDDTAFYWGGTPTQRSGVEDEQYLVNVADIAGGYSHLVSLLNDGTVYCTGWGSGNGWDSDSLVWSGINACYFNAYGDPICSSGPSPSQSAANSVISGSETGNLVTITVTIHDTDDNPYTSGGDTVTVLITGANPSTPSVIDNSDGTYTVTYTSTSDGTDIVTATLNGVAIGNDTDGVSDGVYHLNVTAPFSPTPTTTKPKSSPLTPFQPVDENIADETTPTTSTTTTTTREETAEKSNSSSESDSDNNNHDGFFKTIKSYVVAFLSTSSDAIAKVNYKITSYFTSSKGLGNFLGMVPPALARVFPWLLFALLIYLIRRLIKQTKEEGKNAQEMIKLIDLEKAIGVQKENFVRLSSHYLRTPLTIISTGIDLMFTLDKVEKEKQTDLSNALKDLNTKVEEIFSDISSNRYLNEITIPDIKEEKIKIYASPYLWLPIILIGGISLLTNYLFINIAKIDLYTINLMTEVAAFLVLAQLFFSNFRKRQTQRIKNQKYEKELKLQKVIDDARNTFMEQVARDVNAKMIPLETVLPSVGQTEHKTEIYKGLSDLKQMIYKFTLISSIKSEGALIKPREIDLYRTVNDYIKARQEDIKAKGIKVKLSKSDTIIITDKDKFLFIIFSIIDNAIKFSKDKGSIIINWETVDNRTTITVEDDGIGMTEEAKDLLFKPFVRGTSTLRFDYEGMGTNLYIAKQIANYLNGDISLESEIDKGTKVSVVLNK